MGMFFYWQHYQESPFSLFTPPPLLKLSIWARANGRIASMMVIAFMNWCAFLSWTFWVQARLSFFASYRDRFSDERRVALFT